MATAGESLAGTAAALAASALVGALTDGPESIKVESMSIAGVDEDGEIVIAERAFQWWPETLSDPMQGGWVRKPVPGGSHGLLNWSSNPGRAITFSVVLSRQLLALEDLEIDSIGNGPVQLLPGPDPNSDRNRMYNVDVSAAIAYLRSYMYPRYGTQKNGDIVKPPVTAIINLPNMQLNEDGTDSLWCKMNDCSVNYLKTFPNGRPKIAMVTLTFEQTVQGPDGVRFKSMEEIYRRPDPRGGSGASYRNPRGITSPIKRNSRP